MLIAKEMVVKDKERLAIAGEMLNSFVNSGINGCVLYRMAKVLKPAAKKARLDLRKASVPCWM
jgi:hypothetical protein